MEICMNATQMHVPVYNYILNLEKAIACIFCKKKKNSRIVFKLFLKRY